MDKKRLIELTEKTKGWTKADKEELLPVLEEYGIEPPTKTNCPSCWRDCAIMALRATKSDTPREGLPVLRGDAGEVGVYWHGRYVSNAVMDEELAAWLEKTDFPKSLYK